MKLNAEGFACGSGDGRTDGHAIASRECELPLHVVAVAARRLIIVDPLLRVIINDGRRKQTLQREGKLRN